MILRVTPEFGNLRDSENTEFRVIWEGGILCDSASPDGNRRSG